MQNRPGLIVLALVAACCVCEDAPAPAILRPSNLSIVPAGPLVVIARTAGKTQLELDGKPIAISQLAANVAMASVNPGAGRHELILKSGGAGQKIEFFAHTSANMPQAPRDWKPYRIHPPTGTCESCHAVKDGAWSFRDDAQATSCFGCHQAKTFAANHSHNSDTLVECQMCHHPHGSTEKAHLKMKKELACKQCHG